MSGDIARAGLLIGSLMLVIGIPLLFIVQPGTAESVITWFTVFFGLVVVVAIGIAVRLSRR